MLLIEVNSNKVISDNTKLKDYLEEAINELSDDYIIISNDDGINNIDTLEYVRKYRNILLCIKEICKNRKKF